MRWKQFTLVVSVVALIALAGCSGTAEPDNTNQSKATDVDGATHVIVTDNSAEVVCYVYEHAGYAGGDTTCLDFSETTFVTQD